MKLSKRSQFKQQNRNNAATLFLAALTLMILPHPAQSLTSESILERGYSAYYGKNLRAAERSFKEALAQYEAVDKNHPMIPIALRGLALVYLAQKNYLQAEPLLARDLKIQRQYGNNYPGSIFALTSLGTIRMEQGNLQQAKNFFEAAIALEPVPDSKKFHNQAMMLLAKIYRQMNDYPNEERTLRRMLSLKSVREGSWLAPVTWFDLCRCLANQNKWIEFHKELTSFKAQYKANSEKFNRESLLSLTEQLGSFCIEKLHPVEAEHLFLWGIELSKENPPMPNEFFYARLAGAYDGQNNVVEMDNLWQISLVRLKHNPGELLIINFHAMEVHNRKKEFKAVEKIHRQFCQLLEKREVKDDEILAIALQRLANSIRGDGRIEEANEIFERVLNLRDKIKMKDDTDAGCVLRILGWRRITQGKLKEADAFFQRELRSLDALDDDNIGVVEHHLGALKDYIRFLEDQKRIAELPKYQMKLRGLERRLAQLKSKAK